MVLCNSSCSGHVTKSAKFTGWLAHIFHSVMEKRLEHLYV